MNRPEKAACALTVAEAAQQSVALARLSQLAAESSRRLKSVESLIPVLLRTAVQAGPIDGTEWCLLVQGNAAAAKLRHILPNLKAALQARGCEVTAIRIKVQLVNKHM